MHRLGLSWVLWGQAELISLRHALRRLHYALICTLIVLSIAGCDSGGTDGREAVQAGLSRALADEKLGPSGGGSAEPLPADPLLRSPLRAAHELGRSSARLDLHCQYVLRFPDGQSIRIDERVDVSQNGRGEFLGNLRRDVVGRDGRRTVHHSAAIYVGGEFFRSGSSGEYYVGSTMREEHLAWLGRAHEPVATWIRVLTPRLHRQADAEGVKFTLAREPSGGKVGSQGVSGAGSSNSTPSEIASDDLSIAAWWSENYRLGAIQGHAILHADWNCPLKLHVEVEASLSSQDGRVDFRAQVDQRLEVLAAEPVILAPKNAREARRRRVARQVDDALPASERSGPSSSN